MGGRAGGDHSEPREVAQTVGRQSGPEAGQASRSQAPSGSQAPTRQEPGSRAPGSQEPGGQDCEATQQVLDTLPGVPAQPKLI